MILLRLTFILGIIFNFTGCGGGSPVQQNLGGFDIGNAADGGRIDEGSDTALKSSYFVSANLEWAIGFHLADVNGDNKMDMLMSASPQILLGKGDGTFTPGISFEPTGQLISIQTADFNSDGKTDLVYKSYQTSFVSFRLGLGNGTFGPRTNLSESGAGHNKSEIQLADLNRDGTLDIVTLNLNGSTIDTVETWLNDGHGNFSKGTSKKSLVYGGAALQIADFNRDGNLDVLAQHAETLGVILFLGDGKGGLSDASNTNLRAGGYNLKIGDFNRDGIFDFLVHWKTEVNQSLGNDDGTFSAPTTLDLSVGGFDQSNAGERPDLADIDGDGHLDIITADNIHGTVSVHLGRGDGSFKTAITLDATPNAHIVKSADMDGDGKLDIVVRPIRRSSDLKDYAITVLIQTAPANGAITFAPIKK